MIKNLAPPEPRGHAKAGITRFWKEATPAQQQVAKNFLRSHWLVDDSRHINKRDWFLTFSRWTYHMASEDDIKTCHEETIRIQISPKAQQKGYWSNREQII